MTDPLRQLLNTPLPPLEEQKAKKYRPTKEEILEVHALLNKYIFEGKLRTPPLRLKKVWYYGECTGYVATKRKPHHAALLMNSRYYCVQWMVMILAHEMAHQYQWEVDGLARIAEGKKPLLSHGPSFYKFKDKLKEYGIPLKIHYTKLW